MSQPKIKRLAKSASKSQLLDRLTPVGFTEGDYELMLVSLSVNTHKEVQR
jgi:hypothetical protein